MALNASLASVNDSTEWHPQIYFPDAVKTVKMDSVDKMDSMGDWRMYSERVVGTWFCSFDLAAFPFDSHLCRIEVESCTAISILLKYKSCLCVCLCVLTHIKHVIILTAQRAAPIWLPRNR